MTGHWHPPQAASVARLAGMGTGAGRFDMELERRGLRTCITRQFVSYPFHMTRPFHLDDRIPSLLTIYQQSCSGGLYRGENLTCRLRIGAGAAAHVTTQAATIVHDCRGEPATTATEIELQDGAFLALMPDPLVFFPGAAHRAALRARLAPDAVLVLSDSFAIHDPLNRSGMFDHAASDVAIVDADERLLVRDSYHIDGSDLARPSSPLGQWRIVTSFLLLGQKARLPAHRDLAAQDATGRTATGVTSLPNGAGLGLRGVARDAVATRTLAERIFALCVAAAFGNAPEPRRK